jgi:hypothetical protein
VDALCNKVAFAHGVLDGELKVRQRGSGIKYEERLFDVYTLSDGQCVRKQQFRERSEALDAAGLG